jgi:hypothetical protein
MTIKLTRKQIKEGLEQFPIDTLLMGEPKTLTKKQKDFAEAVAMGKPKAQAYREAYDTHGKPTTQATEAQKLMQNPNITSMIEAVKVSIEAQKYLFPAHLRSLAIQKLTEKALDDKVPPSVQVKALELIGKMTEVSLFTERKEIIKTDNTTEAKTKLLKTLAQAIATSRSISTDKKRDAESLLAEITGETIDHEPTIYPTESELSENEIGETPPTPTPSNEEFLEATPMHSIPHNQSSDFNERILNQKLSISDMETPPLSISDSEGEGVSILHNTDPNDVIENTPPIEIGSHTALDHIPDANWTEV